MPATDQWLSLLQQTVNPALLHSSARPFLELLAPLSPPTTRYKAGEVEWRELSRGQAPGSDGHGARALSHWGGAPPAPQTAGAAEAADEEVNTFLSQWFISLTQSDLSQAQGDLSWPHVASEEEKWPDVPHGFSLQTSAEAVCCRGSEGANTSSGEDSDPEEKLRAGQYVASEKEERPPDLSTDKDSELMLIH